MTVSYRCWAEVSLDALRENLAWLRHQVGAEVRILTVVKADAYGHGLKQIAALLMQSGTDIFGVANLSEAQAIRAVGRGWAILILGVCLPEEVDAVVRDGVMPTISSLEEAKTFSSAAVRLKKAVRVHVKVDTGMGRLGTPVAEALSFIQHVRLLPNLELQGLFMHFASAEDNPRFAARQAASFLGLVESLCAQGIHIPLIHANNSAALLYEPSTQFKLVRPGLLVYGIVPPGRRRRNVEVQRHLRPVLSWKCRVGLVRIVPPGTPVSYGSTYTTPRKMRLVVLTAGYGDGYLRAASNRAFVLLHGRRCRVLGRITMDQMVVDGTRVPGVRAGDEAVLIGRQGQQEIHASQLAQWSGTIPWEILTNITYRVPRIYRGGTAA